tara:strand:+ start:227 stop:424 length:198 start_codon:yes stop_codon:yes gene_type:complete
MQHERMGILISPIGLQRARISARMPKANGVCVTQNDGAHPLQFIFDRYREGFLSISWANDKQRRR